MAKTSVYSSVFSRSVRGMKAESAIEFANTAIQSALSLLGECDLLLEVEVRLVPTGERAGKRDQKKALQVLMQNTPTHAWYNAPGKYLFDFAEHKFMWGNRDLYFTDGEQLYLFMRLVQKRNVPYTSCLTRLRNKFGPDFLKGVL